MSGRRFQTRAKTVQKLGRDGLVEQNKATGEEKRVSQRTADISFGPDRFAEQAAGHRATQRNGGDPATPAKKRRKQPRPVQQTAEEAVYAAQAPASVLEVSVPDAPSMRMAADAPMMAPAVTSEDTPPPPPAPRKRRKRNNRKKSKRRQVSKHTPDAARSLKDQPMRGAGDAPMQNRPPGFTPAKRPLHLAESGGRLHFEEAAAGAGPDPDTEQSEKRKRAVKKRQVMDHAADHAQQMKPSAPVPVDSKVADTHQRGSPQLKIKAPELSAVSADRAAYKKRQAAKLAVHSAAPISAERRRLQFEDKSLPKVDHAPTSVPAPATILASTTVSMPTTVPSPTTVPVPTTIPAPKGDTPPPSRKYEKAVRRVERAEERVERARADLPAKHRLSFQPEPDGETGRPRRRLHFEQEVLPEYRSPSPPARAGGMAKTAAVMKLHGKIHESERQNVAVEATHKSELFAEQGVGRALRWNKNRRRSRPYRALRQAEQRAAKENVNLAWQTALRNNPELRNKNALAKWMQKQKIKRKYAQAAHEAKQTAHFTQNVVQTTGQIVRAVQQYLAARKSLLAVVAMLAMVVVFFSAGLTSCTAMLSGFQSSYISASYMADEQDICNADLYFTELETDLQMDIGNTETNYPGYDEYRYNIGEIGHNPYELMGYLSTAFNAFTFEQVKPEIERLFGEKYQLTRTEFIEDGKKVLQTTLVVRRMEDIVAESLTPGEQMDRYRTYMQTLGNRQAYGNPFDFPWLGYVSSGYGYRVHPISGEKNLHRGVDIAVAQGTPIKAIHDGKVISAGDAGSYGLCVVIEDEKGYQSRYAHCSILSVTAGQEVKRGDVIAAVGSTGNSTGPHLHLEIMLDGEYLNPYYFVDTGDDGTGSVIPGAPGGVTIPDYPGEPPTNETFAAMLEEAEKYLGYPYVWGGSSPSTSFDCSGFVSWVINHSGWDVGRLGAQGLYNICTPVSIENAQPGDLIFFWHTYDAPNPNGVTHVGIYVGNGQMIHCGNPISYANINSNYWQSHFYGYARLP